MVIALTRELSPAIARCELTHLERQPIDLPLARVQHETYEACLREAGCFVERLRAGDAMPDSVFIEDTAVVFDELAIVARPGAPSRRIEIPAVADALLRYRPLHYIEPPGTLDGGDVLVIGRQVFVGRSSRTNGAAIEQVRAALEPHGYRVASIEVQSCLHLKSAATALDDGLLLMNPAWLPDVSFTAFDRIEVDAHEPWAANALRVADRVVYSTSFPRTAERLENRGLSLCAVDTTEVSKAEGAVTCCSLIFESLTDS
jgi:dimethylargininase